MSSIYKLSLSYTYIFVKLGGYPHPKKHFFYNNPLFYQNISLIPIQISHLCLTIFIYKKPRQLSYFYTDNYPTFALAGTKKDILAKTAFESTHTHQQKPKFHTTIVVKSYGFAARLLV